jgi:hypothetical protein
VNLRSMVEHAHFFPTAAAPTGLDAQNSALQFGNLLLPPATGIFATVYNEQVAAGVNDLGDILKSYIDRRMGEHGQRAAYRQLEGLKACKKPRSITCIEWEVLYNTANEIVNWLPGPEAKLEDKTFRRAYLDSRFFSSQVGILVRGDQNHRHGQHHGDSHHGLHDRKGVGFPASSSGK